MAEMNVEITATEQEVDISTECMKGVLDAKKDRETFSSNASTVSGVNSESNSDSDNDSTKAIKKKVPEANLKPMKAEAPNANHPEIENMLALQKLQEDNEGSFEQMVMKAQAAAFAASMCPGGWYEHMTFQQQMDSWQPTFDPAYGYDDMGQPCVGLPFVPYFLAESEDLLPLPSYLPTFTDSEQADAQRQVPQVQAPMNKNAKPFVMNKKAHRISKTTTATKTSCSDEAQAGDDINAVGRTVVATKINRLGFSSQTALNEYFAQFGIIESVCVPQKVKRMQGTQGHLRPSGLGFIVMKTEEDAKAILAAGPDHTVCGKVINVRAFKEGQNGDAAAAEEK